jgi:hypothetical protein
MVEALWVDIAEVGRELERKLDESRVLQKSLSLALSLSSRVPKSTIAPELVIA